MINVTSLHYHDFLFHLFVSNSITCSRMNFLTVYTFKFYCLTVYIIISADQTKFVFRSRSILNFNLAESESGRESFHNTSFLIFHFTYKSISVRSFSRPFLRIIKLDCCCRSKAITFKYLFERNSSRNTFYKSILIRIKLIGINRIRNRVTFYILLSKISDVGFYSNCTINIVSIKVRKNS